MTRKKPTIENKNGKIIRHAARVMADRPWAQNTLGTLETGVCAWGGVQQSHTAYLPMAGFPRHHRLRNSLTKQNSNVTRAITAFGQWLKDNGHAKNNNVMSWNDAPERTKEEVLLYMNKFADEMDPQTP